MRHITSVYSTMLGNNSLRARNFFCNTNQLLWDASVIGCCGCPSQRFVQIIQILNLNIKHFWFLLHTACSRHTCCRSIITEVWLHLRNKLQCFLQQSQTYIYRKTNSWQENWSGHSQTAQWIVSLGQNESSIISTAFIMRQKWDCQTVANVITLANTKFFFQGYRGALADKCSESWRVMELHEYFHPVRVPKGCLK